MVVGAHIDKHALRYVRVGTYCAYYGYDEDTQNDLIMLMERGESDKGTPREGYGVPGGHVDLETENEQPADACIRELCEEVIDDQGLPVLKTVTPDRLRILTGSINYNATRWHERQVGTSDFGFECELTSAEIKILKSHEARIASDEKYAAAMEEKSNYEIKTILMLSPADVLARIQKGMKFAYAHEKRVVEMVAARLLESYQSEAA